MTKGHLDLVDKKTYKVKMCRNNVLNISTRIIVVVIVW